MNTATKAAPWRIDVQGKGKDAELAFVRQGKAFAYLIPAIRGEHMGALAELRDLFEASAEMLEALDLVFSHAPYHQDCRFCGALWDNGKADHFKGCVISNVQAAIRKARGIA